MVKKEKKVKSEIKTDEKLKVKKNEDVKEKRLRRDKKPSAKADGVFLRACEARSKKSGKAAEKFLLRSEKDIVRYIEKSQRGFANEQQAELHRELLKIASLQNPDADWVNLDNAAMIFPATDSADINGMFRLSAILNEKIDPKRLQQALNNTVRRFPTIAAAIKRGMFWFYLEPSTYPVVVEEEKLFPCTRIPMDSRHSCIRVTYYEYRISVDFFHAVTDGNGGMVFLNTLVGAYLRLGGEKITPSGNYLDDRDKPRKEETVDSFQSIADFKTKSNHKDVVSFEIPGERLNNYSLVVVNGSVDSEKLKQVAKAHDATVGQYLTAALIWAIEEDRRFFGYDKKRPVVVSVPSNLRKLYPSPTVRNFIYVMSIHGTGNTDFDEILKKVKAQFGEQNNLDFFVGLVNFNVKSQKNFFLKICPLFLKTMVLKLFYKKMGSRARTSTVSNLGQVKTPKEFLDHVVRYEFILGPQEREMVSFSCCSYNGNTVISASRTIKEKSVVKLFFDRLVADGLDVVVDTNCEV